MQVQGNALLCHWLANVSGGQCCARTRVLEYIIKNLQTYLSSEIPDGTLHIRYENISLYMLMKYLKAQKGRGKKGIFQAANQILHCK